MQLNLDLGTDAHEMCCPTPVSETKEPRKYYPSFHYSGDKPLKIPSEGEMVVRYKKTSSSHSENDGKDHYSCTVEIREIVSIASDAYEAPASKKTGDTEKAIEDFIRERKSKEKSEDY